MSKVGKKEVVKAEGIKADAEVKDLAIAKAASSVKGTASDKEVPVAKETESAAFKSSAADTDAATVKEADADKQKKKYVKKAAPKSDEKKTAKKPVKDAETVQELYVEFSDSKVLSEEVVARIKEVYKNEGHRISSIKKLQVYMNIDQRKAYYVINDKHEGKFVEF